MPRPNSLLPSPEHLSSSAAAYFAVFSHTVKLLAANAAHT